MQVQVLGTGCKTCKNLFEITQKALEELKIEGEVEYITNVTKMIEMGILTSPVLVIDGKVVMNGSSDDIEKIKELILNSKSADQTEDAEADATSGCSCGTGCS